MLDAHHAKQLFYTRTMNYHEKHIQETRIKTTKEKLKKAFPLEDGPFIRALDQELSAMHVHRETYYGGTFTGNHAQSVSK